MPGIIPIKDLPLNLDWDGMDPTGVNDSTAAIQRMWDRGSFGTVFWAPGTYKIGSGNVGVIYGNGQAQGTAGGSTVFGLQNIALAATPWPSLGYTGVGGAINGVKLLWGGASGTNALVTINGPLAGFGFQGFIFDAASLAGDCVRNVSGAYGLMIGNSFMNARVFCWNSTSVGGTIGGGVLAANSMHNHFIMNQMKLANVAGAGGIQCSGFRDAPQNTCYDVWTNTTMDFTGAGNVGIRFGYCDSVEFHGIHMFNTGPADVPVDYDYTTTTLALFPTNNFIDGVDTGPSTGNAGWTVHGTTSSIATSNKIGWLNNGNGMQPPELVNVSVQREIAQNNRTYFVSRGGHDLADGRSSGTLNNTPFGAWATLSHAIDFISRHIDFGNRTVTIQCDGNTINTPGGITFSQVPVGMGQIILDLGGGILTNGSVGNTISCAAPGLRLQIQNGTLTATTAGNCISMSSSCVVSFGNGLTFGTAAAAHIYGINSGSLLQNSNSYAISGGATYHTLTENGATIYNIPAAVNMSGSPAFTTAFAGVNEATQYWSGTVFNGTAGVTGKRYATNLTGVINTNSAGNQNFFPGNSAGTNTAGGTYN